MALVLSTPTIADRGRPARTCTGCCSSSPWAPRRPRSALAGHRRRAHRRRACAGSPSAATAIREGNLDVTADVHTDDELGTLGSTFDSMAGSIRTMTADLRTAADEEAALRGRLEAVVAGMGEALVAVDADGIDHRLQRGRRGALRPARPRRAGPPGHRGACSCVAEDGTDLSERLGRPVLEALDARPAASSRRPVARCPSWCRPVRCGGPATTWHGAVFVLRDVRRERELERMKTEFLANISHELRTPLTPDQGLRVHPPDPRPPPRARPGLRRRDQRGRRPDGAGDRPARELRHDRRRPPHARPAARRRPRRRSTTWWRAGPSGSTAPTRSSAGCRPARRQVLADRTYLAAVARRAHRQRREVLARAAARSRSAPAARMPMHRLGADHRHRPGRRASPPTGWSRSSTTSPRATRPPPAASAASASAWRWCTASCGPTAATSPASRSPARARGSRSMLPVAAPLEEAGPPVTRSLARSSCWSPLLGASAAGVLGRRPGRGRGPPRGRRRGHRRARRRRPRDRRRRHRPRPRRPGRPRPRASAVMRLARRHRPSSCARASATPPTPRS